VSSAQQWVRYEAAIWVVRLALAILAAASLVGCGLSANALNAPGGAIRVVAAESFWGSIAAQVGGSHASITSIIAQPSADPHSYEPTANDARLVADAQYVIVNGAGYDPWATSLLQANPASGREVLNVGNLVGKHAGDNPHLWYSPDYVTAVVDKVRDDLKAIEPSQAAAFDQSAQTLLTSGLKPYHDLIAAIKAKYSGTPVGATESIFAYLAPALGLKLITPASYLDAVSEGTEISAADEATVEQQIATRQSKILVYNSQNTPNNIQAVLNLARAHSIPIASITETLAPATATFQQWQSSELQGIQSALAQAAGS
jgi:zinc/manganese transport system substrate-binding protein